VEAMCRLVNLCGLNHVGAHDCRSRGFFEIIELFGSRKPPTCLMPLFNQRALVSISTGTSITRHLQAIPAPGLRLGIVSWLPSLSCPSGPHDREGPALRRADGRTHSLAYLIYPHTTPTTPLQPPHHHVRPRLQWRGRGSPSVQSPARCL
jgi:hypothetical protein